VYRFALRPRWVVLHVLVAIAAPAFVVAGFWQLNRLDERRTHNALIRERESLPVRSLDDALADGDAEHRRVRIDGTYDASEEIVLIGRPGTGGIDGSHVLTPLRMDSGDAVLVDRGWVPPGMENPPLRDAAPPGGEVTVTGILLPTEGKSALSSGGEHGEIVDRIDVARLASGSDHRFITTSLYVLLRSQDPPGEELPKVVEPPGLGEGPHLGYAIQWFLFVPTLLAVYIVLLRQQARRTGR
jgi:cytochrome oxidase assembly protein ShyY1